jgi:DNA-binding response OmpR family regulator
MARVADILLISENLNTISTLTREIPREGLTINTILNAKNAIVTTKQKTCDVIVLNTDSLGMNGMDLCRILKNDPQTAKIPIIVISETKHEVDVVLSLEIGADDYMAAPLNIRELAARIKAVLRRICAPPPDTEVMQREEILIDRVKCTVQKNSRNIVLAAKEYKLLCFLAETPGKVYSRNQLLENVWNRTSPGVVRTVDVHIRKLRESIEEDPSKPKYIKTLRGIGYFFEDI